MSRLAIRLMGPFEVALAGEPATDFVSDKARALLAYVAVEAGKPHRRSFLAGLLWPDQTESAARANLRRALANVRRVVGDLDTDSPLLHVTHQTIQCDDGGDVWLDVREFMRLADSNAPMGDLAKAVDLHRGGFLEGLTVGDSAPFEEWSLLQREQLNRLSLAALQRLTEHRESNGDYEQALGYAWRQVSLDSLREDAHRQVVRLLALTGQRSAALTQYEAMRRTLADELGLEPEAQSAQLYEQIRSGELERRLPTPSTGVVSGHEPRSVGECPYRGLAAFREDDAKFFHGRDGFVARLVEAVSLQSVVAVIVGPSGSGKSSTVNAGLLPRLRADASWLVARFRPGSRPYQSMAESLRSLLDSDVNEIDGLLETAKLANALRHEDVALTDVASRALEKHEGAERLLLVLDQAEELYTLCPDPDLQRRFLDGLLVAFDDGNDPHASPFRLLLTLRADFMGRALSHRPFADALQNASLMLGPMNRDELRLTIERPAEQQGAAFEAGLVDRLLDDVGDEPGNLPLLEFALTLLWEAHTSGWLTHAGYEEIGRVDGSLSRYADEVYEQLDEGRREDARRVFLQLVRPGKGTEDTRRLTRRAEMPADVWPLVQHLADKRLVVTGRDATGDETAEVVHEALIQRWGRLQKWMDSDRVFRTWQEGLRVALAGWEASDRDAGALLHGVPLTQAEGWLAERSSELGGLERDFIEAAVRQRDRSEAESERRRRIAMASLVAGLLIAVTLSAIALNARSSAQREAEVNRSLALAADAGIALENGETDLALALALEAVEMDEPPAESVRRLAAIAQGPGTRAVLAGHTHEVRAVALDPDAGLALSGSCADLQTDGSCARGELILWDLERRAEAARLDGHAGWVNGVAFSPDGAMALSGSGDGTLVLWDVKSGGRVRGFEGHAGGVNAVAFSPDGASALSASDDATLVVWDLASGREVRRLEGHRSAVTDAVFHPSGLEVLSVSDDLSFREWSVATGEETRVRDFGASPKSLAIDPSGRRAILSIKIDLRLWDIPTWLEQGHLKGHGSGAGQSGDVNAIVVDSRGVLALSGGSDTTVRLWDLAGRMASRRFDTDGSPLHAVAVSSDGSRLLTGTATGETILWDVDTGEEIRRFGGGEGSGVAPGCVAFGPDLPEGGGNNAALVCAAGATPDGGANSLVLWNLETGEEVRRFGGHVSHMRALAFSPDGRSALAGSQGRGDDPHGDLIHWDLETGDQIRRFEMTHDVADIEMSADGSHALTGSVADYVAILWDTSTGREIRRFEGHALPVLNVAYGSDEATAITASFDASLILWDLDTAEIIRRFVGHSDFVWGLDVSPNGRWLASSSNDGQIMLWDVETGEELRRIDAHAAQAFDLAFHPEGGTLFSVGVDGELVEWQMADPSLDELLDWVHANRLVRQPTCEERERYHLEATDC